MSFLDKCKLLVLDCKFYCVEPFIKQTALILTLKDFRMFFESQKVLGLSNPSIVRQEYILDC